MNTSYFPFKHLVLVVALSLSMVTFVAAKFTDDTDAATFNGDRVLEDLAVPEQQQAGQQPPIVAAAGLMGSALRRNNTANSEIADGEPALSSNSSNSSIRADVIDEVMNDPQLTPPAPKQYTHVEEVRSGDNLSNIFKRQALSATILHRVMQSGPLAERLKQIFPGHRLTFTTTESNELVRLEYSPGPLETLQFDRDGKNYLAKVVSREPQRLTTYKHGMIDHSLFVASQRAGLDDEVTMRLAQIFQWDIDFVLDIRKGDEFHVLFEELYLGDKFIGYGEILAAEFLNQKTSYQAMHYRNEKGDAHYFNPQGESMRKAFLRAPVSFSRISSNFNLRRKHPLFKTTRPHRGIDYAAPQGTPIMAAGDGRITRVGRSKGNGNYIVLQHGEQFVTKYLHMSKFARNMTRGTRVKQGQVIGYVGRTGYATGPHLHYEFLVNGAHRNPRTVKLPNAQPVPAGEKERFASQTGPYLALLQSMREEQQLAIAN